MSFLVPLHSTAESDLKEMRETTQCLQGALETKMATEQALRQQLEAMESQLEEAHTDLRKAEEAAETLRQELGQLREEYERGVHVLSLKMVELRACYEQFPSLPVRYARDHLCYLQGTGFGNYCGLFDLLFILQMQLFCP